MSSSPSDPVCGFLVYSLGEPTAGFGDQTFVDYVLAEPRRRGVGSCLLSWLLITLPQTKRVALVVHEANCGAIAFYRSLGFREELDPSSRMVVPKSEETYMTVDRETLAIELASRSSKTDGREAGIEAPSACVELETYQSRDSLASRDLRASIAVTRLLRRANSDSTRPILCDRSLPLPRRRKFIVARSAPYLPG